jgi:hypothetical protein
MLFCRYAHIKSNVNASFKLKLIIDFHAKIAEKINSK